MSDPGYVYILSPKDLDLPLSKIGKTTRTARERCAEINKSSTGDLLWQVEHEVYVDNCQAAESLLHKRLVQLRQRGREFFEIRPDEAFEYLLQLLEDSDSVKRLDTPIVNSGAGRRMKTARVLRRGPCSVKHEELDDIYQVFRDRLGVEGKTFGQTGSGSVGLSDNNDGVQWNFAVREDTGDATLGVNLEGKKYRDWPILRFILHEMDKPSIESLIVPEFGCDSIDVCFHRDAWQFGSRLNIRERKLKYSDTPLSNWNNQKWCETLVEAKACFRLDSDSAGRGKQEVTVVRKNGTSRIDTMEVTPHLGFKTIAFNMSDRNSASIEVALEEAFQRLDHVYAWVSDRVS